MSSKRNGSSEEEKEDEEELDPYDARIEKSGCAKYHYALQDCYAEKKDWRKCTKEMEEFRKCFDEKQKLAK